jgi:hypothetical protein
VQRGEFQIGKIVQVSMILLMAIAISHTVAFTLWPSSAINDFRQMMIDTMDQISESLGGITHSFLRGANEDIDSFKFESIEASHRTVFSSLLKTLKEAKYEHYIWGTEKQYHQETLLVESLQRLSQNIGGLRSAALTQFSLLKEVRERESAKSSPMAVENQSDGAEEITDLFTPPSPGRQYMPVDDSSDTSSTDSSTPEDTVASSEAASAAVFHEFIYHLGPPMVTT